MTRRAPEQGVYSSCRKEAGRKPRAEPLRNKEIASPPRMLKKKEPTMIAVNENAFASLGAVSETIYSKRFTLDLAANLK